LADPHGTQSLETEIRAAQELIRRMPQQPEHWTRAGHAWVRKAHLSADPGFYTNVTGCVEGALRGDPRNLAARNLRGLVFLNNHRFAEAQREAEGLLQEEPQDLIALGTLSDALLELGKYDEAAEATQRLMDLRPGMASYSRASYFRWLHGDRQNAKQFLQHALSAGKDRRNPEPAAWAFVQAGMLLWHEADYEGADAVFAEALKWVPDYPVALVGRGRVALSQSDPARASEYLEKAYRLHPLPETAWLLGDARAALGDEPGSRAAYEHVIQDGRKNDPFILALFYATKNQAPEEALRLIERERITRGGIYLDDTYAWVLYRLGKITEARKMSDAALRLGTPDAQLLYHAGAIRMAAGDSNGHKLIEQALALNPHFDWTGTAEARTAVKKYAKNTQK
jgi:tetratricopeptide (TPR) repeat protein